MKKNANVKRMLTGAIAVSALCSLTAFAEEPQATTEVIKTQEVAVVDQEKPTEKKQEDTAKSAAIYKLQTGTIESIREEKDGSVITISNNDIGMVFNTNKNVPVINRKDNKHLDLFDLKVGMEITAVLEKNAPMTMSIPPMTNGAVAFIANSNEGFTALGNFDMNLINADHTLKLNITEDTVIRDIKGTKKIFTADDVQNSESIVFYTASTKSIPAQTTPSFIMILGKTEIEKPEEKPADTIALRAKAENAGFKVTWIANDKPVVLEKDGLKIEVLLGTTTYVKNNETLKASMEPELIDSRIYVASDFAKLLK